MMKNRPALRTYLWCWSTSSWQKVKISLKEKVAIMKSMGLNFFCNLEHRCQYFFYIFKLTLYFYFQIPSEIKQPWQTSAIKQKAYPAEWDQNRATINRKISLKHSKQPIRKNRFCASTQDRQQNDNITPKPQQVLVTDHIWWKPPIQYKDDTQFQSRSYSHSHTKCKFYYQMGRDWVV